uniref:Alternative protein n=1 Tax=Panagrellus redivivus TaxID=6233 RepID=A0A7E4UUH0_PANRE
MKMANRPQERPPVPSNRPSPQQRAPLQLQHPPQLRRHLRQQEEPSLRVKLATPWPTTTTSAKRPWL